MLRIKTREAGTKPNLNHIPFTVLSFHRSQIDAFTGRLSEFQLGEAGGRGVKTRAVDVSFLVWSGGIVTQKILKSRGSKMVF